MQNPFKKNNFKFILDFSFLNLQLRCYMIFSFKSLNQMKITSLILLLLTVHLTSAVYEKNYDEAYTIAVSMSLDQKIGQTIQVDFYGITSKTGTSASDAIKYSLGSILIGGNGAPDANGNCINFDGLKEDQIKEIYASATADKWKALSDKFTYTVNVQANNGKSYKIKSLLATDAVHGDQHVAGSILFPHNIGLSCSRNSKHFYNSGYWTAKSLKSYGFNYAFAPTVAVSHNPQWGRYYETMGQ
jgi:beta-glucosidase